MRTRRRTDDFDEGEVNLNPLTKHPAKQSQQRIMQEHRQNGAHNLKSQKIELDGQKIYNGTNP